MTLTSSAPYAALWRNMDSSKGEEISIPEETPYGGWLELNFPRRTCISEPWNCHIPAWVLPLRMGLKQHRLRFSVLLSFTSAKWVEWNLTTQRNNMLQSLLYHKHFYKEFKMIRCIDSFECSFTLRITECLLHTIKLYRIIRLKISL